MDRQGWFSLLYGILIVLFISGVVGGFSILFLIPQTSPPSLSIGHATVALTDSTESSQIMGDWNINFWVYNYNSESTIDYKNIQVSVSSLLGSSEVTVVPGFQQQVFHSYGANARVRGPLPRLDSVNVVVLPFDVEFDVTMRYLNWMGTGHKFRSYRYRCNGLKIMLEPDQTQGNLLGVPIACV